MPSEGKKPPRALGKQVAKPNPGLFTFKPLEIFLDFFLYTVLPLTVNTSDYTLCNISSRSGLI